MKKIVLSRMEDDLIEPEALDFLIDKTGGVLRHVFDVHHNVAIMEDAEVPLKKSHIQYGLSHLKKEFWHQITLPRRSVAFGAGDCGRTVRAS